mmetsp:Transcript_12967/g.31787  ORF Transcript_12967/g.31787 Transcript_12967/m.31787 type:complete len:419 (+) Transcript_12967:400-1656(+)|eukprot:CAMPEP_0114514944 /NCGR_PEP_ID=MMETSP0109-20121206/16440_1 /TAXON_ID=29199 /ORGANISM="Chlorarachnion reptans, Strain CCCM449" /LENGTH=418 /DNA_ID=CAMNT_0001695051 /DNA_START=325 /DNA_END=1581 /DNA_ORIENTATION=-
MSFRNKVPNEENGSPIEILSSSTKRKSGKRKGDRDKEKTEGRTTVRVNWGPERWSTLRVDWGGKSYRNAVSKNVKDKRQHRWLGSWLVQLFKHLTLMELLYCQQVCRNWRRNVDKHFRERPVLDFDVFWNLVGRPEYMAPLKKLQSRFKQATTLNLRYCNHLGDEDLKTLLEHLVSRQNLEMIDLFYCFSITSKAIAHAVELCPKLRHVVLNFCVGVDNQSIVYLSNLPDLEVLEMSSLTKLTKDIWNIFQESKFDSLEKLYLENCSFDSKEGNNQNDGWDILVENKDGTEQFTFQQNCFQVIRSQNLDNGENEEDEDPEAEISAPEESELDENLTDREDSYVQSGLHDRSMASNASNERSGTNLNIDRSRTNSANLSKSPPPRDESEISLPQVFTLSSGADLQSFVGNNQAKSARAP